MHKEVDFLIVGYGIAGACFAKQCLDRNQTFHIIGDFKESASHVAAGIYNPIVLKRFSPVWKTETQMELLHQTFSEFELLLNSTYIYPTPIYRIFANNKEKETWKKKIPKSELLNHYLNQNIKTEKFQHIIAPCGFGEIQHCGWVDIAKILNDFFKKYARYFTKDTFDYNNLKLSSTINYKNIRAKNVVFSEGIHVKENPYFNFVPIIPNKGEILIIESEKSLPNIIFKSKNFLMPLGNQQYYVGATYDRDWETEDITKKNKILLQKQLNYYFNGNYTILKHQTALRPTTHDRRAIVGKHPNHSNLFILNGMGTRGTFNAPYCSRELMDSILYNKDLQKEIDVKRYYKFLDEN